MASFIAAAAVGLLNIQLVFDLECELLNHPERSSISSKRL